MSAGSRIGHAFFTVPAAMIACLDDEREPLPPSTQALPAGSEAPGLLAFGGRLSIERLAAAVVHRAAPYTVDRPVVAERRIADDHARRCYRRCTP